MTHLVESWLPIITAPRHGIHLVIGWVYMIFIHRAYPNFWSIRFILQWSLPVRRLVGHRLEVERIYKHWVRHWVALVVGHADVLVWVVKVLGHYLLLVGMQIPHIVRKIHLGRVIYNVFVFWPKCLVIFFIRIWLIRDDFCLLIFLYGSLRAKNLIVDGSSQRRPCRYLGTGLGIDILIHVDCPVKRYLVGLGATDGHPIPLYLC